MAKDPAFLFYSSDFLSGTILMTDEQVGKYIRLLCIQHQKGFISEKDMLKICKTKDEDIYNKFIFKNGNFFNQRLKDETDKRKKYSESRSNNRKGKKKDEKTDNICKTYDKHMENENVNENEDINNNKSVEKNKKLIPPTLDEVKIYFIEKGFPSSLAEKAFDYYNEANWHDSRGHPVKNWKQKMISNWLKEENKQFDGTKNQNSYSAKSTTRQAPIGKPATEF